MEVRVFRDDLKDEYKEEGANELRCTMFKLKVQETIIAAGQADFYDEGYKSATIHPG